MLESEEKIKMIIDTRRDILKSSVGKVRVSKEELEYLENKYGDVRDISTDEILSDLSELRDDDGDIWQEYENSYLAKKKKKERFLLAVRRLTKFN